MPPIQRINEARAPRQAIHSAGPSKSEKRHNRALARIRVRVEHALAGVKRARIVKEMLRNTKAQFSDLVMAVACGLHNLRVQVRKRRLKI